ncbi:hypothetical protein, partial [Methylomonas fluvii]
CRIPAMVQCFVGFATLLLWAMFQKISMLQNGMCIAVSVGI